MANLKAIRNRIKSVQATKKITSAMKLVAAAKVRRAQVRVQAARPFTAQVVRLLTEALNNTSPSDLREFPLLSRREPQKVGLIIISSDRGLCGAYNTSIFRHTLQRIDELEQAGQSVALITVGMKASVFFKSAKQEKLRTYTLLPAIPSVQEANLIADTAAQMFTEQKLDAVEIISTKFISMLRSEVVNYKFLPIELPTNHQTETQATMLFEPSIQDVLQKELLPKYIENVIYQALIEASASELAARMNAMTNAAANATELIGNLTLTYNKARQASITQELLEIVGGAEALKG